MNFFLFLTFGFGLRSAWSSPIEVRGVTECQIVDDIVLILKLADATPFCSSFLSIPIATAVSTFQSSVTVVETTSPLTVSTTTDYTSTETDVTSTTATTATLATVVTTEVITATSTALTKQTTATVFTNLGRRVVQEERGIKIPAFLEKFASSAISTACSCLSIPQSTFKITTTTVSTIPATATSSVTEIIFAATTTDTTAVIFTDLVIPITTSTTVIVLTTETIGLVATDCPQAIQDPGFENGINPPQWQITNDHSEGTFSEIYVDTPQLCHSGENCLNFDILGPDEDNLYSGSFIFSVAQIANICPHQQLTLGFWMRWEVFSYENACRPQVCMASQCKIFTAVEGSSNIDNSYVYYSFLGPVPDGSTTMDIEISANGGNAGNCSGLELWFDDFTLE